MIEWIGLGLPEKDVRQRLVATIVVVLIASVVVAGVVFMSFAWPAWIALLGGLAMLAVGVCVCFSIIGRIVAKKVEPPSPRFEK